MITQDELKELLDYNPETGIFVWKVRMAKSVKAGMIAGVLNTQKYRCITIAGTQYKAHRLAWVYIHGEFPKMLDHVDGNRDNNAIINLRLTTVRQNGQNRKEHRVGKTLGCYFHKPTGKWRAQLEFKGRNYHLGLYETAEEAFEAYSAAVHSIEKDGVLLIR